MDIYINSIYINSIMDIYINSINSIHGIIYSIYFFMGIYCLKQMCKFCVQLPNSMVSNQIFPIEMATLRWPIPPIPHKVPPYVQNIPRSPNMNRWDSLTRSGMRQQIWHRNIYKYYIIFILYYII
jgi:hypothetical protein